MRPALGKIPKGKTIKRELIGQNKGIGWTPTKISKIKWEKLAIKSSLTGMSLKTALSGNCLIPSAISPTIDNIR